MKNRKSHVHCIIAIFIFSQVPLRAETDALAEKVAAFTTSIEASLAASKQAESEKTKTDAKPTQETESYQITRVAESALTQLRMLEAAIRRNDSYKTRQIFGSLDSYGAMPQMPGKWNEFLVEITEGIEARSSKFEEQWFADVRGLAKDAHETCLAAKNSGDLDAILMRTAVFQMKQVNRENVLMQRGRTMLNGIANSLQKWASFLDQRDAGNNNEANEILKNFGRGGSEFPVLSGDEIRARMLPAEVESSLKNQIGGILTDLKTLEDLPAVIERWKAFQSAPKTAQTDVSQMVAMTAKLELLLRASKELKAGNGDEAMAFANDSSLLSGNSDMIPYLKPLIDQAKDGAIAVKIGKLVGPQPGFEDNPGKAINEALAALKQKGDYQGLLELLKLQQIRSPREATIAIAPIERYLSAKRFESSGDILMALSEYRSVVANPAGPLLPHAEAGEALQRLEKEHPDAMKDANGALMQEIRSLRDLLQLRGTRYPGARNY